MRCSGCLSIFNLIVSGDTSSSVVAFQRITAFIFTVPGDWNSHKMFAATCKEFAVNSSMHGVRHLADEQMRPGARFDSIITTFTLTVVFQINSEILNYYTGTQN